MISWVAVIMHLFKASRLGLRVCDLVGDFGQFELKFRALVTDYAKRCVVSVPPSYWPIPFTHQYVICRFPTLKVDIDAELKRYQDYGLPSIVT